MLTLRTVALAQFRLVLAYLLVRKTLIGTIVTFALTGLVVVGNGVPAIQISGGGAGNAPEVSIMFMGAAFGDLATGVVGLGTAFLIVCLYGFLASFRVWRDASPRQRGYHWTLPVERSRHDLIRVAAGAALLLIVVALLAAVTILAMFIGGHAATLRLVPASFWIAFMIVPLLLYLLSTIVVLRSDRPAMPILVALGSLYGMFLITMFSAGRGVIWALRLLVTGPHSLTVAIAGPVLDLIRNGLPAELSRRIAESGLNTDAWPAAFTLWFALALAGVIVAASIRPRKS